MLSQNNERMQKPGRRRRPSDTDQLAVGVDQPDVRRCRPVSTQLLTTPRPEHTLGRQCNGGKTLEHLRKRHEKGHGGARILLGRVEGYGISERVLAAARSTQVAEMRSLA